VIALINLLLGRLIGLKLIGANNEAVVAAAAAVV